MSEPPEQDSTKLPAYLQAQLSATKPDFTYEIIELKGEISTLQDALDTANNKYATLESETKTLRDNLPIKKSAIKFAKWYLVLIPLISLILLICSANEGFQISIGKWSFSTDWNMTIGPYTQSALVVGAIAFIATVLGFMLKGVLGQQSSNDNSSMSELVKIMANTRGS